MKSIHVLAGFLTLTLFACGGRKDNQVTTDLITNSQTANGEVSGKVAALTFTETTYDFGEVIEGQIVEHVYRFKNTGENDLIIFDAKGSCGCTVPEYPKAPIKPGSEGEIKVKFDTNGKKERQEKTVTLTANTQPNVTTLTIKGFVKPSDK
ncbi:MAG: DUF1573 domain-containing protein [Candidatus Competibacteraceae bacterium]|nr:DUF1573 domain-containing protein [Candidatus Competibacteraceae bacterium]